MYKAPISEINFLLKDLFRIKEIFSEINFFGFDEDTLDEILNEVRKLSENLISPINREGDIKQAYLKYGALWTIS